MALGLSPLKWTKNKLFISGVWYSIYSYLFITVQIVFFMTLQNVVMKVIYMSSHKWL
jgi:hypothetical protein